MWFILPQLSGLGYSAMAQRYAIRDMDQARRYLADPILGDRLRHDVRLMIRHKSKSALGILESPDELKFRSCLTLFREAASDPTIRYSRRPWSSSTTASRTLAPWNCSGPNNPLPKLSIIDKRCEYCQPHQIRKPNVFARFAFDCWLFGSLLTLHPVQAQCRYAHRSQCIKV